MSKSESITASREELMRMSFGVDCSVASQGSALPVGCTITHVNDHAVCNPSDLSEELRRCATDSVNVTFTPATQKEDEFDMNSDEDEATQTASSIDLKTIQPATPPESHTAESIIEDATKRVSPGKCVLLLCDQCNPAVHVEAAASKLGAVVMHVNATMRVKAKMKIDEYAATLRKSLEKGMWLFIENATKSITLLQKLVEILQLLKTSGKLHPASRILLLCEPHPHFPVELLDGAVTLVLKTTNDLDTISVLSSDVKRHMGLQESLKPSEPPTTASAPPKKKVKISCNVEVIRLETSTFLEMSASASVATGEAKVGLHRVGKYRFGATEKLIGLCAIDDDRYAIGTSGGYVVVTDSAGLPLITYRPHKGCVWDLAFVQGSTYNFATASEDGTSSIFHYDLSTQTLESKSIASFQSDVFALAYVRPSDPESPVVSGGLSATLCVFQSNKTTSSFIPFSTSVQALRSLPVRGHIVVGGGTGVCSVVDPLQGTVIDTVNKHVRKVPAVATYNNMIMTGGFDKTIFFWDARAAMQKTSQLALPEVITAVAVHENYATACCGTSLYLWDIRSVSQVLDKRSNAWNGLTRGLSINSDTKSLVTASVDGLARYWYF